MHAKKLAALLDGREYCGEITREEGLMAKAAGLVVVYGQSDDLVEFDGAIMDEFNACNGTTVLLTPKGVLEPCEDDCPHYERAAACAVELKAIWDRDGYLWVFEAPFPHETFEIFDDGDKYCRGIVFALADITNPQA